MRWVTRLAGLLALTERDSPTFWQLLIGLGKRLIWFCLVSLFTASLCWCVIGAKWTVPKVQRVWRVAEYQLRSSDYCGLTYPSLLSPHEQSELWQERLSGTHTESLSAQQLLGAAVVLGKPANYATAWLSEKVVMENVSAAEAFQQATTSYRSKNRDLRQQFSALATDAEPHNVEFWRVRAMLTYPYSLFVDEDSRSIIFEEALQELLALAPSAKQHDPQNGLYDYLIAALAWGASAELASANYPMIFREVIKNSKRYDLACHHFEAGQRCRAVMLPEKEMQFASQFCIQTGLRDDSTRIAATAGFDSEVIGFLKKLRDHLEAQAESAQRYGDPERYLQIGRQQMRLAKQLEVNSDFNFGTRLSRKAFDADARKTFRQVRITHPELTSSVPPDSFERREVENSVETAVRSEMAERLQQRFSLSSRAFENGTAVHNAISSILWGSLLCLLAMMIAFVRSRFRSVSVPGAAAWLAVVCYSVCFVGAAIGLAVVPAELVGGVLGRLAGVCGP